MLKLIQLTLFNIVLSAQYDITYIFFEKDSYHVTGLSEGNEKYHPVLPHNHSWQITYHVHISSIVSL